MVEQKFGWNQMLLLWSGPVFRGFSDHKLQVAQVMFSGFDRVQNMVTLSLFKIVFKDFSLMVAKSQDCMIKSEGLWGSDSYLTHYKNTNFRLFQTERVCGQQFQIWQKWQKVIQTGRKHCGKRRNCSLRAISPFPIVFSKGLFPSGVKRCHCVEMG